MSSVLKKETMAPTDKHCKLIDFSTCTEQEVFLEVCTSILCPISTTVKLERNYANALETLPDRNLLCGNTGIGDSLVWHGFPDALVNCTLTICSGNKETDSEFEYHPELEASDSDDDETVFVTTVEAKRKMTDPVTVQFIAQCVVNSFIDKNTTGERRLQPAVLINVFNYCICFYDCTRDILLLSSKKGFDYCRELMNFMHKLYEVSTRGVFTTFHIIGCTCKNQSDCKEEQQLQAQSQVNIYGRRCLLLMAIVLCSNSSPDSFALVDQRMVGTKQYC